MEKLFQWAIKLLVWAPHLLQHRLYSTCLDSLLLRWWVLLSPSPKLLTTQSWYFGSVALAVWLHVQLSLHALSALPICTAVWIPRTQLMFKSQTSLERQIIGQEARIWANIQPTNTSFCAWTLRLRLSRTFKDLISLRKKKKRHWTLADLQLCVK